ncbi:MAG: DUF2269 family protein [Deltaproteobacteria bacterium]|jgi:hypothetical protein|nr:DUF2269 family protein [Deltaproteobacteria bacterium]
MKKLGSRGQKVLKTLHLIAAGLWVGGAVGLTLLIVCLGPATSGPELLGYNLAAILVDDLVIIPGAMGCLITGLLISGLTPWGFFKRRWILIKWILTVFCILFGTFYLGPPVNNQPAITTELGLEALNDAQYHANYIKNIIGGIFQLLALAFMVIISVFKPWPNKAK